MSLDQVPTDVVLLRFGGRSDPVEPFDERWAGTRIHEKLNCTVARRAWSAHAGIAYVYLQLPNRTAFSRRSLDALAEDARAACNGASVTASRLTLMQDLAGASSHELALFHYVVEMTPEPDWEIELQCWYDNEHLPGLAGVPGCVRAQRFWNNDDELQSLACYDLIAEQTTASFEWLTVRGTAWSERVRPHFMSPVRSMFTFLR
ncbi:hypothetical protein AAFF27_22645 [Xylophilus sp. GW821-FHT01B05]